MANRKSIGGESEGKSKEIAAAAATAVKKKEKRAETSLIQD